MSSFIAWTLLLARTVLILSPGYIHPDEFFQSQEVMAADVLGVNGSLPWEFDHSSGPLFRSYVPILLTSGLSMLCLRLLDWVHPLSILYTPRLLLLLVSFGTDKIMSLLASRFRGDQPHVMFLHRSSWVTLLFFTRPFSNTLETFLLYAAVAVVVVTPNPCPTVFGALVALGLFTRITFPLFAFPVGLYLLYSLDQRVVLAANKKDLPVNNIQRTIVACETSLKVTLGGSVASLLFVLVDSLYFSLRRTVPDGATPVDHMVRSLPHDVMSTHQLQIAPWNNALYNSDTSNLAQHGIHPRFLHVLVNMQILFGPLLAIALASVVLPARRSHCRTPDLLLLVSMVAFPLAALSFIPHQEPRFLLPLQLPLTLLVACRPRYSKSLTFKCLWLAYNAILLLLFSTLHQGGVVQALHHIWRNQASDVCIAGVKSYSIPRFLLHPMGHSQTVRDFGSAPIYQVTDFFESPPCGDRDWVVIAPLNQLSRLQDEFRKSRPFKPHVVVNATFYPHLSLESPPEAISLHQLGFAVFNIAHD